MSESDPGISFVLVAVLLVMAFVFLVAPPVVEETRADAPEPVAAAPRPPDFADARLPAVELRRNWAGFAIVPKDDADTPLHFEILPDGRQGWGATWLGQRRIEPEPGLVKVRLAAGRGTEDLADIRRLLARAGMMAPDAPLGEESR